AQMTGSQSNAANCLSVSGSAPATSSANQGASLIVSPLRLCVGELLADRCHTLGLCFGRDAFRISERRLSFTKATPVPCGEHLANGGFRNAGVFGFLLRDARGDQFLDLIV